MNTTIKDIAKKLGVSHATVSRALRDSPRISDKTKRLVRALAKSMNYRTNALARSLVLKRSQFIGVIVPDIENPYYTSICKHLIDFLEKSGYRLIICNSDRQSAREQDYVEYLYEHRVAGYVIVPTAVRRHYFAELIASGSSLVLIDYDGRKINTDSVTTDNFAGAVKAVDHLVGLGYRRIAHVAGPGYALPSRERLRGYIAALSRHGFGPDTMPVVRAGTTFGDGVAAAREILRIEPRPDAVCAVSDIVALGVLQGLREEGVRVPRDVALVGFDDIDMARMLPSPLTTVRQSTSMLAGTAGQLLLERIEAGGGGACRNVVLQPELVIRQSCGENARRKARKRR
jgi:LacI family transcriptional regulator